jgi:hypothetical protein
MASSRCPRELPDQLDQFIDVAQVVGVPDVPAEHQELPDPIVDSLPESFLDVRPYLFLRHDGLRYELVSVRRIVHCDLSRTGASQGGSQRQTGPMR